MRINEAGLIAFAVETLHAEYSSVAGPFAELFPITIIDEPPDDRSLIMGEYTQVCRDGRDHPTEDGSMLDEDYDIKAKECIEKLAMRACNRIAWGIFKDLLEGSSPRIGADNVTVAGNVTTPGDLFVGNRATVARFRDGGQVGMGVDVVEFDRGYRPDDLGAFRTFLPDGTIVRVSRPIEGQPVGRLALQRNPSRPNGECDFYEDGVRVVVRPSKPDRWNPVDDIFHVVNARLYVDHPEAIAIVEVA